MRACFILVFNLLVLTSLTAQKEVSVKLGESSCLRFRNSLYTGGYEQNANELLCKLQKANFSLENEGEAIINLGKHKADDFHAPVFDTTHGYLNITVQQKNNEKTALLLRYDENLKMIAKIENAEITRINSFVAFDQEKLFYKDKLYVVRPAKDTLGRFYVFSYQLKDAAAVFSYNLKWQFNFDQHPYHRIHFLYASDTVIYAYVICLEGPKKGQWIIALNADDGSINKTIKLNRNDNEFCFISKLDVYNSALDMAVSGVKYPAAAIDLKTGKFAMNYQTSKGLNTFFCLIDSAGEIKQRLDNYLPVPNELLKEKELKEFLIRTNQLEIKGNYFNLLLECLYKAPDGLYKTYGFLFTRLELSLEGILKQENNAFLAAYRNEKNLPGGKKSGNLDCKLTTNQFDNEKKEETDRLFYKDPFTRNFSDASIQFDRNKKMAFMLCFYENKQTSVLSFYKNIMKNYVWETTALSTNNDYSTYNVFAIGENKFIVYTCNKEKSGFTLQLVEL